MSDSWKKFNVPEPGESVTMILKEGVLATVAFAGKPSPLTTVYDEVRMRYVLAPADAIAKGLRVSKRAAMNVFDAATKTMRVIDPPVAVVNQVIDLQALHPLDRSLFSITRTGSGYETRYPVAFLRPMLQRERSLYRELPLHDLDLYIQQRFAPRAFSSAPTPVQPSVPLSARIDAASSEEIVALLASLPPEATTAFLDAFGVTAIDLLPAEQTDPAFQFAAALSGEFPPPVADDPVGDNNI